MRPALLTVLLVLCCRAESRREILDRMELVMGRLPVERRVPLELRVEEEVREAAFTRKRITYAAEAGDRVPAWLLVPHSRGGRRPAALCLHQTIRIGKDEPAGLGGNADLHYGRELAARGYVVLAPDYPGFGGYQANPYELGYASASMKGIWNHVRALDLLESLPEVDRTRIAAVGHSLGGHNALFLAAFDERVRAVVTSCGFTSFRKYQGGDLAGWSHAGYMPRIAQVYGKSPDRMPFDFSDVLRVIAPRAVFVSAPVGDTNFDASGVDDTLRAARPGFASPERLVVVHPNTGHALPPGAREQAYAFLDRELRNPQRRPLALRLMDARKIWDRAPHNAFTDLTRFRDRWHCVFREGQGHVSTEGKVRVLSSPDGLAWSSAALLALPGRDLRDPKLAVAPGGRLMLTAAAVVREGAGSLVTLAWFSKDGGSWTPPREIGKPGLWLWRITWDRRVAYGAAYGRNIVRLYRSGDGLRFDPIVPVLFDRGYPNESSLLFRKDGTALCLLRRDRDDGATAQLGSARPPYTDWRWKDLGVRIGGPHMIELPGSEIVAAVRLYDGKTRTSLCRLDPEAGTLAEVLELPSGGDTSYAGLAFHAGVLWVSYYSSHEGKTSIYLARIRI